MIMMRKRKRKRKPLVPNPFTPGWPSATTRNIESGPLLWLISTKLSNMAKRIRL
jgi:hypothetical protein